MHLFLQHRVILFLVFLILPTLVSATSWPVFTAPDKRFLLTNNYIDTSQCPRGQGKLVSNSEINIHDSLCKTYCPSSWTWAGKSDNQCHELISDFQLQYFTINRVNDSEGTTIYSVVTAQYGQDASHPYFTFTFVSPKENWFCMEMNPALRTLTCANDT